MATIFLLRPAFDDFQTLEPTPELVDRFAAGPVLRGVELGEQSPPWRARWSGEPGRQQGDVAGMLNAVVVTSAVRRELEHVASGDIDYVPVAVDGETRWALNVVNVVDALDDRTSGTWSRDRTKLLTMTRLRFKPGIDAPIFLVPERLSASVFVTDLVAHVLDRFTGASIRPIWWDDDRQR